MSRVRCRNGRRGQLELFPGLKRTTLRASAAIESPSFGMPARVYHAGDGYNRHRENLGNEDRVGSIALTVTGAMGSRKLSRRNSCETKWRVAGRSFRPMSIIRNWSP